jgi:hypothetical protein
MSSDLAVFFDIGDTLASAVVEAGDLARLVVYPFGSEVLGRLRCGGAGGDTVALGLISNTGAESAAGHRKCPEPHSSRVINGRPRSLL